MQSQTASYCITTLVTPPATTAVTSLANVKAELGITDTNSDAWITANIPRASAAIARHCNRVFGQATWQDSIRPQKGIWGEGTRGGVSPLVTRWWPLVSVTSVTEIIGGVATALVQGTDFEVETASLLPGDEGAGRLWRLNEAGTQRTWPAAQIIIVYVAGYFLPNDASPTLPPEIEMACIRLIAKQYWNRSRDPSIKATDQGAGEIGRVEYWVTNGSEGNFPPDIAELIDAYRVPVIA